MSNQKSKGPTTRAMEAVAGAFATGDGDTSSNLSFTGSPAAVTGLVENAVYRLVPTASCYVRFADSGDADSGDMRLIADQPEFFLLQGVSRISALAYSSNGVLNITRMG